MGDADISYLLGTTLPSGTIDAANGPLKGVLAVTDQPLVSSDLVGNPNSSIIDLQTTEVIGGTLVKVLSWYDNEWGFSNRMTDLAVHMVQ